MMMTTMRIWKGGEGRGRGREKDDETTTAIRDMGNIRPYHPAMMMGGTMTRTFPSSRHWISAMRQPLSCHGRIVVGLLIIVIVVVKGGNGDGRSVQQSRICGHFCCK